MNEELRKTIAIIWTVSLLTITSLVLVIGLGIKEVAKSIKDKEFTNISEYLKLQDQKIDALQKSGDDKSIRIDQLDKQRGEEIETWQLALDGMTETELQAFWDKWAIEVCPKYEQEWYCKGDK